MRKLIYILTVGIALVLTVSVSLMSVGAADTWCTQINISTYNCFKQLSINGSFVNFGLSMSNVTDTNYPILKEFGLKYYYSLGSGYCNYFANGTGSLFGNSFNSFYSSSDYASLGNVYIDQYEYFTFTVITAITDNGGNVIDGAKVNCGLTSEYSTDVANLECQFVDFIEDNGSFRCFTFGMSSRDLGIPEFNKGKTVASLLTNLELHVTPHLYQQQTGDYFNKSFKIFVSDLTLRLYTTDDVFANAIGGLEDAINKGNQDVLDKIDSSTSQIIGAVDGAADKVVGAVDSQTDAILNADAPGEDIGGDVDDAADGLENAEAAVDAVTPDFDAEILTGVPEELGEALSFIGLKLDTVIDGQFGTVVFFCLSFGVAMTLVGRAVR